MSISIGSLIKSNGDDDAWICGEKIGHSVSDYVSLSKQEKDLQKEQ